MQPLRATVGAEIRLHGPPPDVVSRLRRTLRLRNPEYLKAQKGNQDTDGIDEHIYALDEDANGDVTLPRGAVEDLRVILHSKGIKPSWQDRRNRGFEIHGLALRNVELRDYQAEGVEASRRELQGLVELPCGGGKTMLGIGAIAAIGRSTLVVVPTRDLVEQWDEKIREHLGVRPAIYGAGKQQLGAITIATRNALTHKNHVDIDLSMFGTFVYDECHRSVAASPQALLRRVAARHRIGLTATAYRDDGLGRLIPWSFGETILKRSTDWLVKHGWLIRPRVERIDTDFTYELPDEPKFIHYTKMNKAIIANDNRNERIADIMCAAPGAVSLSLSPSSRDHCEHLAEMCRHRGLDAHVLHAKVGVRKRRETIAGMRDGSVKRVFATSLADEGLDIPRLSRVVLALPERTRSKTEQRSGRLARPHGIDQATLYDVVDPHVENLWNRWNTRKSVYKKLKLEIDDCPSLFSMATA